MTDNTLLRAQNFFERIAGPGGLESLGGAADAAMPSAKFPEALRPMVESAAGKLATRGAFDASDRFALEAIIIPDRRPAVLIERGDFQIQHKDWMHLNSGAAKANIKRALPSIGRVELPNHPSLPYAGTGFVVGDGILMTNRHVAEIFSSGLGLRGLRFLAGMQVGIDFVQEQGDTGPRMLVVRDVLMIHPFWDMALLRVEGLSAANAPLVLSPKDPDDLLGADVAVIGYPAFDPRNKADVQNLVFGGVYNVKRLQPGKIGAGKGKAREAIASFGNTVAAVTHDASTLGGNSGSAVIDPASGHIVGLHFAGVYLDANYAVPTIELARDARVVNAGVNFAVGVTPDPGAFQKWWRAADAEEGAVPAAAQAGPAAAAAGSPPPPPAPVSNGSGGAVSITIPLEITVRLGTPQAPESMAPKAGGEAVRAADVTEKMAEPAHDDDYSLRRGYDPGFLGIAVPLPAPADLNLAAKLDDGAHIIPYHHFSLVMHKRRRLAMFTASNVDTSPGAKQPEPGKRYTRGALGGLGEGDVELWFTDPRLPAIHQLPDRFFTKDKGAFDRGHLVRREDVAWGTSFNEVQAANGDTFHVTNCSPQTGVFNRPDQKTNWGELEKFVAKEASQGRLTIFAGPVLADGDRLFSGVDQAGPVKVQIPAQFWKVIVAVSNGQLQSFGFVLRQDLANVPLEFAVSGKWLSHMVPIAELEKLVGLVTFPDAVRRADQARTARGGAMRSDMGVELAAAPLAAPATVPKAARPKLARSAQNLAEGPLTFRDPQVSLFQSAAAAVAAKAAGRAAAGPLEGMATDTQAQTILAAEAVASLHMDGRGGVTPQQSSGLEKMSALTHAATCAGLAFQLLKAKLSGNAAAAAEIEANLNGGTCDKNWAQTITEYAKAYGLSGDPGARSYVTPKQAGERVIEIKAGARVALIGDWGTGAAPARRVLDLVKAQKPDVVVHLGDIYYSGTPDECRDKFEAVVDQAFDRKSTKLPVYSLCGNHDMYCGGVGYYGLIKRLNQGKLAQGASFFCLRAADNSWQLLAMDTGRNDYSPFSVTDTVTFVEPEEQAWLVRRVAEFAGKTILLSHHQLFSAFSQIGSQDANGMLNPVNPNLKRTFDALLATGKQIPAWIWGHEHNLCVYEPYGKLQFGRCLGHSAIPVFAADTPYEVPDGSENPPKIRNGTELSISGDYYTHGFAMLALAADGSATAEYFEDLNGKARLIHRDLVK